MNSRDVLTQSKTYTRKNISSFPYINLNLLLWPFPSLACPSGTPLGQPTALTETPPSPSAPLGTRFPLNLSAPSANTLAQVEMNKHCQSIWEQTRIISQLRVSLCFSSRSVAFAIPMLLVSPVERSLLLINYLVRLDHSTPRQFLFTLFCYRWRASRRAKFSGKQEKMSQSLFFPFWRYLLLGVHTEPAASACCAANCLTALRHGAATRLLLCSGTPLVSSATLLLHFVTLCSVPRFPIFPVGWCSSLARGSSSQNTDSPVCKWIPK